MELKALTLWQPWASLCFIPRPCECRPYWPEGHPAHVCACDRSPFKTIETRGWPAPKSLIGQRIAIHAAKREPRNIPAAHPMQVTPSINGSNRMLAPLGMFGDAEYIPLPLGAVVGTAVLADCVPIHHQWCRCSEMSLAPIVPGLSQGTGQAAPGDYMSIGMGGMGREVLGLYDRNGLAYSSTNGTLDGHPWTAAGNDSEDVIAQIPFGHFDCGRWAWLLTDQERFDEPVPARGGQRIWNWERPS